VVAAYQPNTNAVAKEAIMIKKTDSPATRSVEVAIDVPGTPEEVWQAIATGPGFTAWFVPTRIEEREEARSRSRFAPGMESRAS
jgi:uncharacterized protein YndB with AHSA1/START domain